MGFVRRKSISSLLGDNLTTRQPDLPLLFRYDPRLQAQACNCDLPRESWNIDHNMVAMIPLLTSTKDPGISDEVEGMGILEIQTPKTSERQQ